jgi:hypothetical protein
MKKFIVNYITQNYYLDKSEVGNAGIYAYDDNRVWKVPVNADKLIKEIVNLFGYSYSRTKWFIHKWAKTQKPDYCLKFYWYSNGIDGVSSFPPDPDRNGLIQKWISSGLLEGLSSEFKTSIGNLLEPQTKSFLRG